jgi:Caspase domain
MRKYLNKMSEITFNSYGIHLVLCGVLLWLSQTNEASASTRVDPQHCFAVLVGVQNYPHLAEAEQLHGSRNDVQLMSELLVNRFQFPHANIRALLDEQATGATIRGTLDALVQQIETLPPDTQVLVVFHFSGHGSQVVDQSSGPDADELDGLDETIVPFDAMQQGGDADIRDDELNTFAHQICKRNASRLWMILDCCHSGTGIRGASTTRFRALARTLESKKLEAADQSRNVREKTFPAGAVALYACQSVEKEPEFQDDEQTFGLLTRFMTQVLNETNDLSKLSYGSLVEAIESRYRQDRRVLPAPRPRLEGVSQQIVCGAGPELDRTPYWRANVSPLDRGQVSIHAGAFHGVTVNSLYQLYRTAETVLSAPEQAVAWLRIREVDLTTSQADVLQRDGDEWFESRLPRSLVEGVAVERYRDHGDFGARIRVVTVNDDQQDSSPLTLDDPRVPVSVRDAFVKSRREDESDWLRWGDANEPFDLLLRFDRTQAALFPAIAMTYADKSAIEASGEISAALRGGWGPIDLLDDSQAAREIQDAVRRITRARNLIRLVDLQQSKSQAELGVHLTLEKLQVAEGTIVSREPWSSQHGDRANEGNEYVVSDGQYYDWRVTNGSDDHQPVYVTVLQVDSNMGIQTMLPAQLGAESPRLHPGESLTTGGYECCRDDQGKAELGPRWTIVVATREPNQYSWLSQDSLPRIRGSGLGGLAEPGMHESSLDRLLLGEMYFKTRGDSSSPRQLIDPSWSVGLRQWLAVSHEERKE